MRDNNIDGFVKRAGNRPIEIEMRNGKIYPPRDAKATNIQLDRHGSLDFSISWNEDSAKEGIGKSRMYKIIIICSPLDIRKVRIRKPFWARP